MLGLKTKAETLAFMKEKNFCVPDLYFFTQDQWSGQPERIFHEIRERFDGGTGTIIVRSSSHDEDGTHASMAGCFESVTHVDPGDSGAVSKAIERVIASYKGKTGNQVLVQAMVEDVELSGVIMTRCLGDGSPYYVINYDDSSGLTGGITGGGEVSKTVYVYRGYDMESFDSVRLRNIVLFARSIEDEFGTTPLDIEFAIDRDGRFQLFQVRRICTEQFWQPAIEERISKKILYIEQYVTDIMKPRPGIFGRKTTLGVMPDWNPAEMIGTNPRPLASSLYRTLITKKVWREARQAMGYRKLPPEELMVFVAGCPYIDVRNSFNSFLPQGLDDTVGEKLVNAWIDYLDAHPECHDKVEFDVAQTAYDFDFGVTLEKRYPGVLTRDEQRHFRKKLIEMTAGFLRPGGQGKLHESLAVINGLHERQNKRTVDLGALTPFNRIAIVRQLITECIETGTFPFTIIARHAFVAESLLRSMISNGIVSEERVAQFKRGIRTVSQDISEAFIRLGQNRISKDAFLSQYGHLRPGTYNIQSPCYSNRVDIYQDFIYMPEIQDHGEPFTLTGKEKNAAKTLIDKAFGNDVTLETLLDYAETAIKGREFAKFVFTRNVSDILEVIAHWGESMGFTRDELSFLTIGDILESLVSPEHSNTSSHYGDLVEKGREKFDFAGSVRLSYLIRAGKDVYVVPQHRNVPNYITGRCVEGRVAFLSQNRLADSPITGCIVLLENADPGFDWIFSKGIAGLVTKFGGTNSHMAIRCSEYGIPAAIGCGGVLFDQVKNATRIRLNSGEKVIQVVK